MENFDLFISYSHRDQEWVQNWLLPRLECAELRVCVDWRNFDIGVASLVNMERAVEQSRHTLLVLTPNWVNSEWAEFEELLAHTLDPAARRRRLLPLLLQECNPPRRIAMLTYADFTKSAEWEAQITRVIAAVSGKLQLAEIGPQLSQLETPLGPNSEQPFLAPPLPPYPLVGRHEELIALKHHLLTPGRYTLAAINGLPGVGKTALAIELAHDPEILNRFKDGVLWANLGRQPDVLSLLGNWALVLGIPTNELNKLQSIDARARMIHTTIGQQNLLLVVDDAWDVESALAFQVGGPNCAQLVTTRFPEVALRIAGVESIKIGELTDQEGLALLSQRAPDAVKVEPEAAHQLVRAVGSLPLALILAGNFLRFQAHSHQPRRVRAAFNLLQNVEQRLVLAESRAPIEGSARTSTGAQISLQATIALSEQTLPALSRQVFYTLSVFPPKPNTFSEEAALFVSATSPDTLDVLTDFGLLESNIPGRYMMHQTIADYAGLQLTEKTAYRRMADFFINLAESLDSKLGESDQALWLDQLELEHDNLRATLDWAEHAQEPDISLRLSGALGQYWWLRGLFSEGRRYLDRTLAQTGETFKSPRAKALYSVGRIAFQQGDLATASQFLTESLTIYTHLEDKKGIANSHFYLGYVAYTQGSFDEANDLLSRSLEIHRALNDQKGAADALGVLGHAALSQGNFSAARSLFEENLALCTALSDKPAIANSKNSLGILAHLEGNYAEARTMLEDSLKIFRELRNRIHSAAALGNLGYVALDEGNYTQARAYFQETLTLARSAGAKEMIANSLEVFGNLATAQSENARALRLFGAAESLRKAISAPMSRADLVSYNEDLATIQTQLGESTFATIRAEGQAMSIEQAIEYAFTE